MGLLYTLFSKHANRRFHMSGQKKDEVVCLKCYDSHSSEYGAAECKEAPIENNIKHERYGRLIRRQIRYAPWLV